MATWKIERPFLKFIAAIPLGAIDEFMEDKDVAVRLVKGFPCHNAGDAIVPEAERHCGPNTRGNVGCVNRDRRGVKEFVIGQIMFGAKVG